MRLSCASVEHVIEIVADDEQGDTPPLQCVDQLEDLALLLDAERRGRLVHDDQAPGFIQQEARNCGRLALAARQLADRGIKRRNVDIHAVEQCAGAHSHTRTIENRQDAEIPLEGLAPQEDIACHIQIGHQRKILVHGLDSERAGLLGTFDLDLFPVEENLAPVATEGSGDHLDDSGLPGAIVAHQCDGLSPVDVETDVANGVDSAEGLLEPTQRQKGSRAHTQPPFAGPPGICAGGFRA